MNERRIEGRLMCADLVRVEWNTRTLEGVLEDISPQGACIQVDEAIPEGEAITISEIEGHSPPYTGWVTYCEYRGCGYFVGIRFSRESTWSPGVFEPQHLTDIEALAGP